MDDESFALAALLARQKPDKYKNWCWINPPFFDDVYQYEDKRVWSTQFQLTRFLRQNDFSVHDGLNLPTFIPEGVLLFWPKSHEQGLSWIERLCQWLPKGIAFEIIGAHQGGIKRLGKVLTAFGLPSTRLDNAKRCSLWRSEIHSLAQYHQYWQEVNLYDLTLITHPGVFAYLKADEGTRLLLEVLKRDWPSFRAKTVIDAGCGNGALSVWCAQQGADVTAIDSDEFALEACQRSLARNQLKAKVFASDMFSEVQDRFDCIVSNPPFHQSRQVSLQATQHLIEQANEHLLSKGRLYLVANRFLPYEALLRAHFYKVEIAAQTSAFQVFCAQTKS